MVPPIIQQDLFSSNHFRESLRSSVVHRSYNYLYDCADAILCVLFPVKPLGKFESKDILSSLSYLERMDFTRFPIVRDRVVRGAREIK